MTLFLRSTSAPQVVLIDMDDIVCRLLPKALRVFNEDHGTSVTVEDITTWNTKPATYALDRAGFFDDLEPVPGAIDSVERLRASGKFDLRFLTSPWNPACATSKYNWILRHFPWADISFVHLTHAKWSVFGDFLIDDSPKNLLRWSESWPHGQALTITYPYNASISARLTRFDDYRDPATAWQGITDLILGCAR